MAALEGDAPKWGESERARRDRVTMACGRQADQSENEEKALGIPDRLNSGVTE